MVDASDAALRDNTVVATALAAWASQRFGGDVRVVSCSTLSGGLDNYVHAVHLSGADLPGPWQAPLVVRIAPSPGRIVGARAEMAIQNWAAALGYPAASVLALLHDDWSIGMPAQVAVRADGGQMLDIVKREPLRIISTVRAFANLHADLHDLPTDDWPVPDAVGHAATWRFNLIRDREARGDTAIGTALRTVEAAIDWCRAHPVDPAVCHGDFHPLNVVCDPQSRSMIVVDWTDATLDDPHADVARTAALFRCAAVAGETALERVALRIIGPLLAAGYLRAYQRRRPLDPARLRRWESLHLLNGWAQICSLGDAGLQSSAAGREFPSWIVKGIQRRLDRTLRRVATSPS